MVDFFMAHSFLQGVGLLQLRRTPNATWKQRYMTKKQHLTALPRPVVLEKWHQKWLTALRSGFENFVFGVWKKCCKKKQESGEANGNDTEMQNINKKRIKKQESQDEEKETPEVE